MLNENLGKWNERLCVMTFGRPVRKMEMEAMRGTEQTETATQFSRARAAAAVVLLSPWLLAVYFFISHHHVQRHYRFFRYGPWNYWTILKTLFEHRKCGCNCYVRLPFLGHDYKDCSINLHPFRRTTIQMWTEFLDPNQWSIFIFCNAFSKSGIKLKVNTYEGENIISIDREISVNEHVCSP